MMFTANNLMKTQTKKRIKNESSKLKVEIKELLHKRETLLTDIIYAKSSFDHERVAKLYERCKEISIQLFKLGDVSQVDAIKHYIKSIRRTIARMD